MKFSTTAITSALLLSSLSATADAFMTAGMAAATPTTVPVSGRQCLPLYNSAVEEETAPTVTEEEEIVPLTMDLISKLQYRDAKKELERLELDVAGTLSQMKDRLRDAVPDHLKRGHATHSAAVSAEEEDAIDQATKSAQIDKAFEDRGIQFVDSSDPDFEFNDLVRETLEKADMGHWKAATRKLKKLSRRFGKSSPQPRTIPQNVYDATLEACIADRLHGARAAEPARKILDQMVEEGFPVSGTTVNYCLKNILGTDPNGSHQGFGGVDTALAIMATAEASIEPPVIETATYEKLAAALASSGSVSDALAMLRFLVVDKSETPSLKVFADVAMSAVQKGSEDAEQVLTLLAYAKAAGYNLDNIAATIDGRNLLAAAVIAAEMMDNLALGLRLLTAASKAEGCAPDRGDDLVASSSSAAQRAATIIHRRAIDKASQDESWKLAVKLLELMVERSLRPSPSVWRNVVSCCAKAEKSRKAAALLFDWVKLSGRGRAEKPPLRVFNTVINACEICGEEELTVKVLDSMKATHQSDGNLITFNIALKRLAKQGNVRACEGIIVSMLQSNVEPSVVSYTTAIAACVSEPMNSEMAEEWITRMRSRNVTPNVITYNTALASCLDGTLEATARGSRMASAMLIDVQKQLEQAGGDSTEDEQDKFTQTAPNFYTKTLSRQLMKQLKANWESKAIDRAVAKTTLRLPFRQLVEFEYTEAAERAKEIESKRRLKSDGDQVTKANQVEEDLEFSVAVKTHRAAAV